METKLFDLGTAIVRAVNLCSVPLQGKQLPRGTLRIMQPATAEDGTYFPASDVYVQGADSIRALRDACNFVLEDS